MPFVLFYGFATWVVCAVDGSLLSAWATQPEAEAALALLPVTA